MWLINKQTEGLWPVAVTDGGQRDESSTRQAKFKSGPPFNLHFGFSILLVFSRLLFAFFGVFSGDLGALV